VLANKKLILAHFWLAFAVFGLALCLGAWQMFVRSPLYVWISDPEWYYRSLTAHGTVMGYVFPTLVAMGFGYAITESALEQRLVGLAGPGQDFGSSWPVRSWQWCPSRLAGHRCSTPSIRR